MRVVNMLILSKSFKQLLASFIIGCLVGAGLVTWWVGERIDYLMSHNERLQGALDTKETQLKTMEESLASQKKFVVNDIQVVVNFKNEKEEDEFVKLTIEKKVAEMLNEIWGKEAKTLDPVLIANIVEDRRVVVDDKNYVIKVTKGPLVSEKVLIYVEATLQKNNEKSEQ